MKKLFLIAAMMVATLSASAQNEVGQWSIKPMAGINLARLTNNNLNDPKMRVGLAAGAELAVGAAENFEVSFGALYSMQGIKEKTADVTFKLDYINIPILANLYVTRGLAIKAGIQPGFNVLKKLSGNGASVDLKDAGFDVKGFALSVPVGLSYEIAGVVLDARYNWGLTKAIDDAKNSYFTITLGYKIPF